MRIAGLSGTAVIAGLLCICIGGFAIIEAVGYNIGTATRMGPGYYPAALGVLMIVMGLGIMLVEGRFQPAQDESSEVALRPCLSILTAVGAFAILIDRFGLVPAAMAAVLLSTSAESEMPLWVKLTLSIAVAVFCTLVFVYGLGMRFSVISLDGFR